METKDSQEINPQVIWRHTEGDKTLPFSGFTELAVEMDKKSLKDYKTAKEFEGKIFNFVNYQVDEYINKETKMKFELKTVLYCSKLDKYVQLNKFNAEDQVYNCRVVQKADSKEKETLLDVHQSDLTKDITVEVKIVGSDGLKESDQTTNNLKLQVNIGDKLSKILETIQKLGIDGGSLIYTGTQFEVPEDQSFQKALVLNKGIFIISQGGGAKEPIMWNRFKDWRTDDYFYMEKDYADAICFKPKQTIFWQGFGMFGSWNKKDIKYRLKWCFDDEEQPSEWMHEFTKPNDELQEDKTQRILLKDLGVKPIKMVADQKLHIIVTVDSYEGEIRRHFYGREGYPQDYEKIDQPQDFDVESSRWNNNSTSQSWGQFPYILYSK